MINPMEKAMAKAVLKSAELRELSYDKDAADAATEKDTLDRAEWELYNPTKIYPVGVDYKKFYQLTLEQACHEACKDVGVGMSGLIYLALDGWWNDTISWAQRILDPTATQAPTIYECQHGVSYTVTTGKDDWHCPKCKTYHELCQVSNHTPWDMAN